MTQWALLLSVVSLPTFSFFSKANLLSLTEDFTLLLSGWFLPTRPPPLPRPRSHWYFYSHMLLEGLFSKTVVPCREKSVSCCVENKIVFHCVVYLSPHRWAWDLGSFEQCLCRGPSLRNSDLSDVVRTWGSVFFKSYTEESYAQPVGTH